MGYAEVIFQKQPERFLKRFWQIYLANSFILFIAFVIPCVFFKEFNEIVFVWIVIVFTTLFWGIYSSYKWALTKISCVSFDNDVFTIRVVSKNVSYDHQVAKADLTTKLQWRDGKQTVLMLTVFNKGIRIIDVYSARKRDEYDLENIAYQIYKIKKNKKLIAISIPPSR